MSREAKVQAVVEAAERYAEHAEGFQREFAPKALLNLMDAVRALHEPEPKWRVDTSQGDSDAIRNTDAKQSIYFFGFDTEHLRDRVLRLLLADEAKEGQ